MIRTALNVVLACMLTLGPGQASGTGTGTRHPVVAYPGLSLGAASATDTHGWRMLLDRPWRIGDEAVRIEVGDRTHGARRIGTCSALFRADAEGLSVRNALDAVIYRARATDCYAVRATGRARASQRSFVADFAMDPAQARTLPVRLAFAISPDEERRVARIRRRGGDLGDFIGTARIEPAAVSAPGVRIDDRSGGTQRMRLLARGDFDGDGTEDLLIATDQHVAGGSYRSFGLFVVTRTAAGAPLKLVRKIPVMGPDVDD